MHSTKTIDKKRKSTKTNNKSSKKKKIVKEDPEQKILPFKPIETSKPKKEEMTPEADDGFQKYDAFEKREIYSAVTSTLPNDILLIVLRNLDVKQLLQASRVNSHWMSAIRDPQNDATLWKSPVLRSWGLAEGDVVLACDSWRHAFQKTPKASITQAIQLVNEVDHKLSSIILANLNLTVLPSKLFELSKLQKLSLFGNLIEYLPKEIESMASLIELTIYRNQLTSFPSEVLKLPQLQALGLSYNKMTCIPKEICSMSTLKRLELDYNHLESVPEQLKQMSLLRTLYLTGNSFEWDYRRSVSNLTLSLPYLQDHDLDRL